MLIPSDEHTSRPWRIHELTQDFRLEDVWELPEPGGPDDFPRLVQLAAARVPTLRDRLPADLRDGASGPEFDAVPFTPLYLLDDEFAAEAANETMHGVLHLSWVPDETGGYRARMAVYVKPNGLLGNVYMAAIRPFRHILVYPPMLREISRTWRAMVGEPTAPLAI